MKKRTYHYSGKGQRPKDMIVEENGRWFIVEGFAGFDSVTNQTEGYNSASSAEHAVWRFQSLTDADKVKDSGTTQIREILTEMKIPGTTLELDGWDAILVRIDWKKKWQLTSNEAVAIAEFAHVINGCKCKSASRVK